MTIHFAYPNVIPREGRFIGCGRYGVFVAGSDIPDGYVPVETAPNTPNRTALEFGLQLLGPDSFAASRIVYERKDRPEHVYQGDSLDLAYLLAHLHRGKELQFQSGGDIWGTGVIQTSDNKPLLRKVDDSGFALKLNAFLDIHNGDNLFIVPAANLTNTTAAKLVTEGVSVLTMAQALKGSRNIRNDKNTIIKVLPNELPALVTLLFSRPAGVRKRRTLILAVALLVALGGLSGMYFLDQSSYEKEAPSVSLAPPVKEREGGPVEQKTVPVESVSDSSVPPDPEPETEPVEQETEPVESVSESSVPPDPKAESEPVETVSVSLEPVQLEDATPHEPELIPETTPLEFAGNLIYRLSGEEEPANQPLHTSGTREDLVLSHRDFYRIELALPPETTPLFLYVYQLDSMGNLDTIYPNKFLETSNPVQTVNGTVHIPVNPDDWLYLSKLDEQATGLIKERLFILLSSHSLNEVETLFAGVHEATDEGYRKLMLERFLAYVEGGSPEGPREFTLQKMHFWHDQ